MTSPGTTSFTRYAARLSWVCPILTILTLALLMLSGEMIARRTIAVMASTALALLVVGLILGLVSLVTAAKHGPRSVLMPAIAGVVLNGVLLSIVIAIVVGSKARRIQPQGGTAASAAGLMWSNTETGSARALRAS